MFDQTISVVALVWTVWYVGCGLTGGVLACWLMKTLRDNEDERIDDLRFILNQRLNEERARTKHSRASSCRLPASSVARDLCTEPFMVKMLVHCSEEKGRESRSFHTAKERFITSFELYMERQSFVIERRK